MTTPHAPRRRMKAVGATGLSAALALTLGVPATFSAAHAQSPQQVEGSTASASGDAASRISPGLQKAEGQITVYVQFKGKGAYEQTQSAAVLARKEAPANRQAQVQAIAAQVQSQAQSVAAASGAKLMYTTHNAMRGAAITGDAAQIRALAERPDVERISPIIAKERMNSGSEIDTKTLATWTRENTGYTGKGVKIAVVDSGVDYTHADFGGPGTVDSYLKAKAMTELPSADSGLIDRNKFIGGIDLVGDDYNASVAEKSTPQPDNNPLDCRPDGFGSGGHGTHVAGTAAGYGVTANGTTYRGDYKNLTEEQLKGMSIGPGTAPEAQILAIRVFGCYGNSSVVMKALDTVMDPNGDGDFSDRADIVNLSLGGEFAPADDPESYMINTMARQGVFTVAAAGNANNYNGVGDTYSDSGSPANAAAALSVANAYGSTQPIDRVRATTKTGLEWLQGDYSVNFDYSKASADQLRGEVVAAPKRNRYACEAFTAEEAKALKGKWVYFEWDQDDLTFPCGSKVRFDNVQAAGGVGVVMAGKAERYTIGIGGNATIPGLRLTASSTKDLEKALAAGPVTVEMNLDYKASGRSTHSHAFDLNSSSARGQHGSDGFIKPDLAAPGTEIVSAAVGTGNKGVSFTGTSMATPHVTGIAALVMQAHQDYNPQMIKAALMNGASTPIKNEQGAQYAVDRVGTGMVNARAAVDAKVIAYDAKTPERVSTAFGVLEYTPDSGIQTVQREIVLDNTDSQAHTYTLSYEASTTIPGVEYSYPQQVSVGAGERKNVTVTVRIDPSKLEKTMDPAMSADQVAQDWTTGKTLAAGKRQYIASASGRLIFSENGREAIRQSIHVAPKPVSKMRVDASRIDYKGIADKESTVTLRGTTLNQGGYRSLLGAFELGAVSGRIPTGQLKLPSNQAVDLQYVGAASDAPALKAAGKNPNDGSLFFGISTWGTWDSMHWGRQVQVQIDTNNDSTADYVLEVTREKGLDYPLVKVWSISGNASTVVARYPLNSAWGDTDTNIMDTNTMILGVPLKDLGLTAEKAQTIKYTVQTDTWYNEGNSYVDTTSAIEYSPFNPGVWFTGEESGVPGLFVDRDGGQLTVHRKNNNKERQALFLHMHNATGDLSGRKTANGVAAGDRAQVVDVPRTIHEARFRDVPPENQFYREITWIASHQIDRGYSDGTFRPLNNMDRATMAAYFYRMSGSPQFTAPSTPSFKDVPLNHPYYKEIEWMKAQGITTGWSDGTFRPDSSVNRDSMAAFFYRYAGSPAYEAPAQARFTDVSTDNLFYREISWLASQGVTTGWPDGSFRPVEPVHRDAMAAFVFRYSTSVLGYSADQ